MKTDGMMSKLTDQKALLKKIYEFINDSRVHGGNEWFRNPYVEVYLRHTTRMLEMNNGKIEKIKTVDVANIIVRQPNTGICTDLLSFIEMNTNKKAIFIENIFDRKLVPFLHRLGYNEVMTPGIHSDLVTSMFKLVPERKNDANQ